MLALSAFLFLTFSLITYFYFEILELIEDLLYDYFSINFLSLIYIFQIIFVLGFLFLFFISSSVFSMIYAFSVLIVLSDDFLIFDELLADLDSEV